MEEGEIGGLVLRRYFVIEPGKFDHLLLDVFMFQIHLIMFLELLVNEVGAVMLMVMRMVRTSLLLARLRVLLVWRRARKLRLVQKLMLPLMSVVVVWWQMM